MSPADIFVDVVDMPLNIHEYVRPNIDGTYSVFLNVCDCKERQEKSIEHAIQHIIFYYRKEKYHVLLELWKRCKLQRRTLSDFAIVSKNRGC
jgi:hypothetical protein